MTLPEKDMPTAKMKYASPVTSMLVTAFQMSGGISPLSTVTILPFTVSVPSSESVQPSPLACAASMAFASGGVSVTRICGRETPSKSA